MPDAPPDYSTQYAPQSSYSQYNPQYAQPAPVVAQPSNVNVVVTQQPKTVNFVEPKNYPLPRDWNSGLCGCFDDMLDCLLTTFCTPCKLCVAANDMGESVCIVCCMPDPLLPMRTKVRLMYGIQGSICDDCLVTTCCPLCAQCQIQRQLKTPVQLP